MKERNINCDLMRVIFMIFVIAVHTDNPFEKGSLAAIISSTIFFLCNSIFFMLSGFFNLQKQFSCKEDYKNYYAGKLISILIPYVIIICLLSLWDMYDSGMKIEIASYIKYLYVAFMETNSENHLWFMYPLIGLLLSTPFLAKMVHSMSDWEIKFLFGIGIIWNVISIYLTQNLGVKFAYSGWILAGWPLYYFVGYYCNRIIDNCNKKIYYVLGGVGFFATILGRYLISSHYKNAVDLAVAFVFFTIAIYVFLEKEIHIKNRIAEKVILFLAKHSFMVYMIHANIHFRITPRIVSASLPVFFFLEKIVVTLIISIIVAVILDFFIIHPIQKGMKKLLLKP